MLIVQMLEAEIIKFVFTIEIIALTIYNSIVNVILLEGKQCIY